MIGVGSLVSLCVVVAEWNVVYVDLFDYGLFNDVSVMYCMQQCVVVSELETYGR
jgi:hypothetical protein